MNLIEKINLAISVYSERINDIEKIYSGTQDKDRKVINYKKRKISHVREIEIYEDFLADLKRWKSILDETGK